MEDNVSGVDGLFSEVRHQVLVWSSTDPRIFFKPVN